MCWCSLWRQHPGGDREDEIILQLMQQMRLLQPASSSLVSTRRSSQLLTANNYKMFQTEPPNTLWSLIEVSPNMMSVIKPHLPLFLLPHSWREGWKMTSWWAFAVMWQLTWESSAADSDVSESEPDRLTDKHEIIHTTSQASPRNPALHTLTHAFLPHAWIFFFFFSLQQCERVSFWKHYYFNSGSQFGENNYTHKLRNTSCSLLKPAPLNINALLSINPNKTKPKCLF